METVENQVKEHESKLAKIEVILESIAENQKATSETMKELGKSMSKQEVLLEKITNLKDNTDSSINRVHRRIDAMETIISTKSDIADLNEVSEKVKRLDPIILFVKYPKVAGLIFVSGYLFAIQEVRDFIFKILGVEV